VAELILRPASNYSVALSRNTGSANYECVDEVISDGDTTYVYQSGITNLVDLYTTSGRSGEAGTINSVTVYAKVRDNGSHASDACRIQVRVNGTTYQGTSLLTVTSSYADYSQVWATSPNTSSAWTWTEIDNLIIGTRLRGYASGSNTRATQVWAVVDYTPAVSGGHIATEGDDSVTTEGGSILITEGVETADDTRSIYSWGSQTSSNEFGLWSYGYSSGSSERGIYVESLQGDHSERGIYTAGFDVKNSDVLIYVVGSVLGSGDRLLYVKGVNTGNREVNLYSAGYDNSSGERGLYAWGTENGSAERSLYIESSDAGSKEVSIYVSGSVAISSDIVLYLIGEGAGNSEVCIYVDAVFYGESSRAIFTCGGTEWEDVVDASSLWAEVVDAIGEWIEQGLEDVLATEGGDVLTTEGGDILMLFGRSEWSETPDAESEWSLVQDENTTWTDVYPSCT